MTLEDNIISLYKEGLLHVEIAESLSSTRNKVWKTLNKEGLFRYKKNSINNNYFSKIDSEQSAYYLGYLCADGSVSKNSSCIDLCLHERDFSVLKSFSEQIYQEPEKVNFYFVPHKKVYQLKIHNKQIHDDLIGLGCVPKKTLILDFPSFEQVPREFMPHFIRGYFDGDGCASLYQEKNSYFRLKVCINSASLTFTEKLINFLKLEGIKASFSKCKFLRKNPYYGCDFYRIEDKLKFYNYMYSGASTLLERKRNKFERFFEIKGLKYK